MAVPLVLDALLDLAGPFLIAVVLFVLGLVGYGLLLALGRLDLVDDGAGAGDRNAAERGDDGDAADGGRGDGGGDDDRPSSGDGV